jgi:hypothetical protein
MTSIKFIILSFFLSDFLDICLLWFAGKLAAIYLGGRSATWTKRFRVQIGQSSSRREVAMMTFQPMLFSFKPEKLTFVNVVTGSTLSHETTRELQAETATRFYFGEAWVIFRLKDVGHHFCGFLSRQKT